MRNAILHSQNKGLFRASYRRIRQYRNVIDLKGKHFFNEITADFVYYDYTVLTSGSDYTCTIQFSLAIVRHMSPDHIFFLCTETVLLFIKSDLQSKAQRCWKEIVVRGWHEWHSCYCVSSKPNYKYLITLMAYSRTGQLMTCLTSISCARLSKQPQFGLCFPSSHCGSQGLWVHFEHCSRNIYQSENIPRI